MLRAVQQADSRLLELVTSGVLYINFDWFFPFVECSNVHRRREKISNVRVVGEIALETFHILEGENIKERRDKENGSLRESQGDVHVGGLPPPPQLRMLRGELPSTLSPLHLVLHVGVFKALPEIL